MDNSSSIGTVVVAILSVLLIINVLGWLYHVFGDAVVNANYKSKHRFLSASPGLLVIAFITILLVIFFCIGFFSATNRID